MAVNTTDPPAQKVVGPPAVIVAVGGANMITVVGALVFEHVPFEVVTV